MTDEEIQKARDNYNRIITDRNLFRKFNNSDSEELEELEKNPKVQRYIFLRDTMDFYGHQDVDYTKDYDKERIVNVAFDNIADKTNHSNKIYVFMGFFDRTEDITVEQEKISYAVFSDLETLDTVTVPYEEYSYFIENNKVIKDENVYKERYQGYYQYRLFKIRKEFFKDLIENDQEKAIQKILKK